MYVPDSLATRLPNGWKVKCAAGIQGGVQERDKIPVAGVLWIGYHAVNKVIQSRDCASEIALVDIVDCELKPDFPGSGELLQAITQDHRSIEIAALGSGLSSLTDTLLHLFILHFLVSSSGGGWRKRTFNCISHEAPTP
jgi:hypothetical protein